MTITYKPTSAALFTNGTALCNGESKPGGGFTGCRRRSGRFLGPLPPRPRQQLFGGRVLAAHDRPTPPGIHPSHRHHPVEVVANRSHSRTRARSARLTARVDQSSIPAEGRPGARRCAAGARRVEPLDFGHDGGQRGGAARIRVDREVTIRREFGEIPDKPAPDPIPISERSAPA